MRHSELVSESYLHLLQLYIDPEPEGSTKLNKFGMTKQTLRQPLYFFGERLAYIITFVRALPLMNNVELKTCKIENQPFFGYLSDYLRSSPNSTKNNSSYFRFILRERYFTNRRSLFFNSVPKEV